MDINTTTTGEHPQMKPDCPLIGRDGNYSDIEITPIKAQQML